MKTGLSTLPILFLLTLIGCETTRTELPEPQKAVGFALRADPVQWEPQNMSEGEGGILIEMVPAGHEISEWTELLVQQILFNDLGFERFVDAWYRGLRAEDEAIEIERIEDTDEAIAFVYSSEVIGQSSVVRFMKGPDAIYSLSYNCKDGSCNMERFGLWREIILNSDLVENPELARAIAE